MRTVILANPIASGVHGVVVASCSTIAASRGFTRLALGHHADDVAETTLLNLFYHGTLDTILPTRTFFEGEFNVVRPMFYLREKDLVRYAKLAGFSTVTCNCRYAVEGKRRVMKRLVNEMRKESRHLHQNLWNAAKKWHNAFGDRKLHAYERDREE